MRIEPDIKLDFSDVLLRPKRSSIESRSEVRLDREFQFNNTDFVWSGIPIISSNMSSVTTVALAFKMAQEGMLACLPKKESLHTFSIFPNSIIPSLGLTEQVEHFSNFEQFKFICLDVANGYIEKFLDRVKTVRQHAPHLTIIAGNVATPEMTEALILAGADIVKVGLGSGAACATRLKTGVGYPQLSAVIECADAAHGLGGHIISDGGCTTPGDVVKAFAAGADFVMLGAMLAGHKENGGDFYGMSSERANREIAGGLKDYRAAEGWEMELPKRGPLEKTLQDILGGLRSACAYVGARRLKDLPKCATFVRVNHQINDSLLEYRK